MSLRLETICLVCTRVSVAHLTLLVPYSIRSLPIFYTLNACFIIVCMHISTRPSCGSSLCWSWLAFWVLTSHINWWSIDTFGLGYFSWRDFTLEWFLHSLVTWEKRGGWNSRVSTFWSWACISIEITKLMRVISSVAFQIMRSSQLIWVMRARVLPLMTLWCACLQIWWLSRTETMITGWWLSGLRETTSDAYCKLLLLLLVIRCQAWISFICGASRDISNLEFLADAHFLHRLIIRDTLGVRHSINSSNSVLTKLIPWFIVEIELQIFLLRMWVISSTMLWWWRSAIAAAVHSQSPNSIGMLSSAALITMGCRTCVREWVSGQGSVDLLISSRCGMCLTWWVEFFFIVSDSISESVCIEVLQVLLIYLLSCLIRTISIIMRSDISCCRWLLCVTLPNTDLSIRVGIETILLVYVTAARNSVTSLICAALDV